MVRSVLAVSLCLVVGMATAQERASESKDPHLREYAQAVQQAIQAKWVRPDSVAEGQRCVLDLRQIPGGEIISVIATSDCEYDAAGKRSIETAALKAQPLPYEGYEDVFHRSLRLVFIAKDLTP